MSAYVPTDLIEVPASKVKDRFGEFQDRAARGEAFRIDRHGRAATVLMSWEAYEKLVASLPDPLASLHGEFDALLARIQAPGASKASDAMLAARPADLGAAAVRAARARRTRKR